MDNSERYQPPQPDASDAAYNLTKAGLAAIPGAGGVAVELLQRVIAPSLEKRRDVWMHEVGEALRNLEDAKNVNLEDLQANDSFIDTVLQASQIALRTSQKEKREALRNSILNSALPYPPEQSRQQMFLGYIDIFTVWHLKILRLFKEPALNPEVSDYAHRSELGGGLSVILEKAFPELRGQRELYDQIWQDLYTRGLVNTNGLHTMMSSGGLLASRATKLGKQFVHFIESPS